MDLWQKLTMHSSKMEFNLILINQLFEKILRENLNKIVQFRVMTHTAKKERVCNN